MTIPTRERQDEEGEGSEYSELDKTAALTAAAIARPSEPIGPLALVETAFMASTAALLWMVDYLFPLTPVLQFLFPLPIALLYCRWGLRSAWLGAIVGSLLLLVLLGPTRGVIFLVTPGCLGVLLGCCWRRRASWAWSIGLGALADTVGVFFRLLILSIMLSEDIWTYSNAQITSFLDWFTGLMGWFVQVPIALVEAIALAGIVLSCVLHVSVIHGVAWVLFRRLGTPIAAPPAWLQPVLNLDSE